jgi:DtxR family Mn-dependent transcriptional regulator
MAETTLLRLSESVQNYLVNIVRLRTADDAPVPLSQLAGALSISPISVNDMCRKLQDQGLVIYKPYKGALLTEEGQRYAYYIVRRHRLWEVFLVEKLGFDYDEAHEAACQLEHATPDRVADRLDAFLSYPAVNPQGEPIPRPEGILPTCMVVPIPDLDAGGQGHIVQCQVGEPVRVALDAQGIRPGASVHLLASSEQSVLLQVDGAPISLARTLADKVLAEPVGEDNGAECTMQPILQPQPTAETPVPSSQQVTLDTLKAGQRGIVVRVKGKGPARRRMMDMGLVPGAEVKAVRAAPFGDPIEFQVKGYSLSLRKTEARNITVEIVQSETTRE